MVERHGRIDLPWSLSQRGSDAMTGEGTLRAGHRRESWRRLASTQARRCPCLHHDETSRNRFSKCGFQTGREETDLRKRKNCTLSVYERFFVLEQDPLVRIGLFDPKSGSWIR